jgi:hypothetical protein
MGETGKQERWDADRAKRERLKKQVQYQPPGHKSITQQQLIDLVQDWRRDGLLKAHPSQGGTEAGYEAAKVLADDLKIRLLVKLGVNT